MDSEPTHGGSMQVGDLVKGKYVNKDQYGLVIGIHRHWEGDECIHAAQVSWDCGEIKWFMVMNLEVVCK